jgi:microcystin-dependent protein
MAEPFLGEIRMFSFNFAPQGWAFCDGQTLPINQNQALFALLGTTYGGNGQTTFQLPNLQSRTPVHTGNGIVLGQAGGETNHTLSISEVPTHTHAAVASSTTPTQASPANNIWAPVSQAYAPSPNTAMNAGSIVPTGGNQPHDNMPPYLVLSFCIALEGIFPSQS